MSAGFVNFDDPSILKDIDGYRGLAPHNLAWMFTTTHMGHYQPLTWLSYAIQYSIWGLDPVPLHVGNILLHALNAALVYFVARRLIVAALGREEPARDLSGAWLELGAAAAALLFAVHPLRVESVAWITERRDVLSTAFLLGSALAYLRAFPHRSVGTESRAWYAASVALLVLSLLSKAWGMTFFAALLIIDWFPLGRLTGPPWRWLAPPQRNVLVQKTPYLLLGVAAAAMAKHASGSMPFTNVGWDQWGPVARLWQATYGIGFYFEKMLWPMHLAALYELPRNQPLLQARYVPDLVIAVVVATAALASIRRWPAFAAAAGVWAVTLSPVLGLNQSGPQLVADRYTYVASIAWAVLIGGGVAVWVRRRGARAPSLGVAGAGLAAVAVVLGVLSWRQAELWRDTLTLFRHGIDNGADGPIIRTMYGRELSSVGRKEEAVTELRRAVEVEPNLGEAWFALGSTLKDLNRIEEAEQAYKIAREHMPDRWRADLMLGLINIEQMDRPREAAERFKASIAEMEAPGNPVHSGRPYLMLGAALDILGDDGGSRRALQKAAEFDDTRDEALSHLKDMDAPDPGK